MGCNVWKLSDIKQISYWYLQNIDAILNKQFTLTEKTNLQNDKHFLFTFYFIWIK